MFTGTIGDGKVRADRSVGFILRNKQKFEVEFCAGPQPPNNAGGRNFLFTGHAKLTDSEQSPFCSRSVARSRGATTRLGARHRLRETDAGSRETVGRSAAHAAALLQQGVLQAAG